MASLRDQVTLQLDFELCVNHMYSSVIACGCTWIWWASMLRRISRIKTGNESVSREQKENKNLNK